MLSALSSYIWGDYATTDEPEISKSDENDTLENDWIFINQKVLDNTTKPMRRAHFKDDDIGVNMEESWLVTPPQCFNNQRRNKISKVSPLENLLIEHPNMSIYQENREIDAVERNEAVSVCKQTSDHKALAGRLQLLESRVPLRDLNGKAADRKRNSPKNTKKKNMVYVRSQNARKNKQYGRMHGKHVGMGGKRAN